MMNPVLINYDICNKDGICSDVCPRKLIGISEDLPVPVPDIKDLCISCGHCMAACPKGAISVKTAVPDDCRRIDKRQRATYDQLDHLMRSRRSTRVYKDKPVERNIIQRILDTCRYAPTGSNAQQVKWIMVNEPSKIKELGQRTIGWMREAIETGHPLVGRLPLSNFVNAWEHGEDRIFRGAPLVAVTYSPEAGSLPLESCVISMTYFDLTAAALGLGACWIGVFMLAAAEHPPIKEALKIPHDHKIFGTMAMGYPKYSYKRIPERMQPNVDWL